MQENTIQCPFRIIIDTAEGHPYTFQGIKADAAKKNRVYIVETERRCLGRFPFSYADYSILGGEGRCHIERKSMDDAIGTILGFGPGERRERFESELENLAGIEAGLVVVECSFMELIANAPGYDAIDCARRYGKKSVSHNAKSLSRSVLAFMDEYKVPWLFCDDRRMAEIHAFRWLERWWRKQREKEKAEEKAAKRQLAFVGEGVQVA